MVKLVNVDPINTTHISFLFSLLKERDKIANISHRRMPTMSEHEFFVKSMPYSKWWIIYKDGSMCGTVYITKGNEIGIQIKLEFQRQGIALDVLKRVIDNYPGELLANIAPKNTASQELFRKLGFVHIQNTYRRIDG